MFSHSVVLHDFCIITGWKTLTLRLPRRTASKYYYHVRGIKPWFFSTNINDISYARFPAPRLALHSTNLALVFMYQGDHCAL